MNVFNVNSSIKALSSEKQDAFGKFYQDSMNKKLKPITMDFTLVIVWVNSLVNIFGQYDGIIGWSSVHPLAYLYCISIAFLALINKFTLVRYKAPLMLYALMGVMMVFAYRDFVIEQGWIEPVMGLYFFLAFIGYVSVSLQHTVTLLLLNTTVLSICHFWVYGANQWLGQISSLLSDVFVFNCTLSALTAAIFVNWIFKNLFAMQFLLNEKNDTLVSTLKMLKVTEEQLVQQQKYQALNHMAKGLLHEIINPVNSSTQALNYAKSITHDEDIGEAIDEAMSQHKRISDIVSDLRRFAQPELNQKFETMLLDELINKAIKFCHRELKKTNVDIKLAVGNQQYIACQPSALTQVFVNLIINACDALKHKDNKLTRVLEISSTENSNSLSICFKDNGVGISDTALNQIQDPFYSSNQSIENLGLGLSICQTIMRHHHGAMQIRSELNEWTEVELTLPSQISVTLVKENMQKSVEKTPENYSLKNTEI